MAEKNNRKAEVIKEDILKVFLKIKKKKRDQAIDNIVKYHLPGIKERKKYGEDEIEILFTIITRNTSYLRGDTGKSFYQWIKSVNWISTIYILMKQNQITLNS